LHTGRAKHLIEGYLDFHHRHVCCNGVQDAEIKVPYGQTGRLMCVSTPREIVLEEARRHQVQAWVEANADGATFPVDGSDEAVRKRFQRYTLHAIRGRPYAAAGDLGCLVFKATGCAEYRCGQKESQTENVVGVATVARLSSRLHSQNLTGSFEAVQACTLGSCQVTTCGEALTHGEENGLRVMVIL
jgi:hypothetical protein